MYNSIDKIKKLQSEMEKRIQKRRTQRTRRTLRRKDDVNKLTEQMGGMYITKKRKRNDNNNKRNVKRMLLTKTEFTYNSNTGLVKFKLVPKMIDNLKKIFDKSDEERKEYAFGISVQSMGRLPYLDYINYNYGTSNQRAAVYSDIIDKFKSEYIVGHTHPSPYVAGIRKNTPGGYYFTIPSIADFRAFQSVFGINGNEKSQAQLILEQHGFYLISVIESKRVSQNYSPEQLYSSMNKYLLSLDFVSERSLEDPPLQYFKCPTVKEWSDSVNFFGLNLFNKTGIKLQYHPWESRSIKGSLLKLNIPVITLRIK